MAEFDGAPALPPVQTSRQAKQEVKPEVKVDTKAEDANGADRDAAPRAKTARGEDSTDVATAINVADDTKKGQADGATDDPNPGEKRKRISDDDEIGSDLDDSDDDDGDGGVDGDVNDDMVLCLYDKVSSSRRDHVLSRESL